MTDGCSGTGVVDYVTPLAARLLLSRMDGIEVQYSMGNQYYYTVLPVYFSVQHSFSILSTV